jgi:hypothetical protein
MSEAAVAMTNEAAPEAPRERLDERLDELATRVTAAEAAMCLEVSVARVRRLQDAGLIAPCSRLGLVQYLVVPDLVRGALHLALREIFGTVAIQAEANRPWLQGSRTWSFL